MDRYWIVILALIAGGLLVRRIYVARVSASEERRSRDKVMLAIVLTYVLTSLSYEYIWMR